MNILNRREVIGAGLVGLVSVGNVLGESTKPANDGGNGGASFARFVEEHRQRQAAGVKWSARQAPMRLLDTGHVTVLLERPADGGPASSKIDLKPPRATTDVLAWIEDWGLGFVDARGMAAERSILSLHFSVRTHRDTTGNWILEVGAQIQNAKDDAPWIGTADIAFLAFGT
jgi:hypothetical protein